MDKSKKILTKIKGERIKLGLSQSDIANELGVSVSTYSRFERGITKTDYTFLNKIINFLKTKIKDYSNGNEQEDILEEENEEYLIKSIDDKISYLVELLEQQQMLNKKILSNLKKL